MTNQSESSHFDLEHVREWVIGLVPNAYDVSLDRDDFERVSFIHTDNWGNHWPIWLFQPTSRPEVLVICTMLDINEAEPLRVLVACNMWNALNFPHESVSYIDLPPESAGGELGGKKTLTVSFESSVLLPSGALIRSFDRWANGFLESIPDWNETISLAFSDLSDDDEDLEDHDVDSWVDETDDEEPTEGSEPFRLHVDFQTGDWPEAGVLSRMGYHVGQSGLDQESRRAILRQVIAAELIADSPDAIAYVQGWGSPGSWPRLQKIYNALTAFSRNARRKQGDYSEAIADWESDLSWLKQTYGI